MSIRFDWVLAGQRHGQDPVCDIDLFGDHSTAVIPTLGSLLAGWLLLVPRAEALSIAVLTPERRRAMIILAGRVSRDLLQFGKNVVFFEHGPRLHGSLLGCGTDQAHLHTLATDYDLADSVLRDDDVRWKSADPDDPWNEVDASSDYYLVCSARGTFVGRPERVESQYFRRHIARISGRPEMWDYREHPCYEQAARTIRSIQRECVNWEAA